MYLLEHDAKTLLDASGIAVPPGCLVESAAQLDRLHLPPAPWVVKAQVPVGGRGKAGLVRLADDGPGLLAALEGMLGRSHRGHTVASCRIETRAEAVREAYLGFMLAPEEGAIRVLVAASGGVEVESSAEVVSEVAAPEQAALVAALARLTEPLPQPFGCALRAAGERLSRTFLERDAVLLEINPLFVRADGSSIAGDAKMVIDDNALARQPAVRALLEARAHAYSETYTKAQHGFDYVVVDREGELGLLTTGAGLSMMLIDELRASGIRPYNFLDVRTGGLRGDPSRLVQVLTWIAQGPRVRCVLVNVFAGITHLGEFSRLLVQALAAAPALQVPVVTRLVGNGLEEARTVLARAGIVVEPDLAKALAAVRAVLDARAGSGA